MELYKIQKHIIIQKMDKGIIAFPDNEIVKRKIHRHENTILWILITYYYVTKTCSDENNY